MTYETLANRNMSEGVQTIFIYVNDVTGGVFSAMFLFVLFMIVMMGSYFFQQRSTGRGDIIVSSAVAGYFVFGASVLLWMIPNIINGYYVLVCLAVAVITTGALLLNRTTD